MSLFVRNQKGQTQTFNFQPSLTVRQLKEELGRRENVQPGEVSLSFAGKYLPDDAAVADHVGAGNTLSMTLRLKGGKVDADRTVKHVASVIQNVARAGARVNGLNPMK